jgi:hypothetical protein
MMIDIMSTTAPITVPTMVAMSADLESPPPEDPEDVAFEELSPVYST